MRRPHTVRSRTRSAARGFTLVEILVVVVIVAIIASMVVLSVNVLGKDDEIAQETRRLSALLEMTREQAEMQNRDFGLRLEERRYDFVRYDVRRGEWATVPGESLYRVRELPPGLRFRLFLEAREAILKPPSDRKKPRPPQVMFLSSGDLTAFELKLLREDSDHEATITGKVDGSIEVKTVDGTIEGKAEEEKQAQERRT
jgi:general secretion pathway protein H